MIRKQLWLDVETTGIDPSLYSIIQIAGIIDINGKVEDEFDFKVQPHPEFDINQQSIAFHGFTEEMIKEFPGMAETHQKLTKLWSSYINKYDRNDKFTVCGQNIAFDINFLTSFFYRIGDNYLGSFIDFRKRIDLLDITKALQMLSIIKSDNLRLEVLCKEFGIEIKAHDALSDIRATRELYYMINNRIKWDK